MLKWYGLVSRLSELAKIVLLGTTKGKRTEEGRRKVGRTTSKSAQVWILFGHNGPRKTEQNMWRELVAESSVMIIYPRITCMRQTERHTNRYLGTFQI